MREKHLRAEQVLRDVGRRIAELRTERGLTQEQFAAKAEISWKYLQQVESGRENLTLRSLVKIANLLSAGVSDLLVTPKSTDARPGRPRKTGGSGASSVKGRSTRSHR